jgi:hypothetical protein
MVNLEMKVSCGFNTATNYGGTTNGICTEDILTNMIGGGDRSLMRFSSPVRVRDYFNGYGTAEVCPTCQTKYEQNQFSSQTKFEKP